MADSSSATETIHFLEITMYRYEVLVCSADRQTSFRTIVYADNDYAARQLAESQYGQGNVLSYHRLIEN